MTFIETPIFTRSIRRLLSAEQYRSLQLALLLRPEQGDVMIGGGGLRKIRWSLRGKGKRGGIRVVYYWDVKQETFYMLLAYSKRQKEDLTTEQVKILKRLVQEEFK
jgi:mRNA-degrading endonuclease RelE of RelBE toxin-antitoxin system